MKISFVITLFMLLSHMLFGQYQNLDKLSPKVRDSILIKVANEAIEKFSVGYLRPGNQPYIEDIGLKLSETYKTLGYKEYIDRYLYAVYYLPTEKEKAVYEKDYLVKALVLADIGKVTEIMYIDVSGGGQLALEKIDPNEKVFRRKFKTVEEYLEEIERYKPKTIKLDPTPEMIERERAFLEMKKRKRDSAIILRQQYLRRRDSIRREDSIRKARKEIQP